MLVGVFHGTNFFSRFSLFVYCLAVLLGCMEHVFRQTAHRTVDSQLILVSAEPVKEREVDESSQA